jgi:L-threonylcarbamoyladenylate synthase
MLETLHWRADHAGAIAQAAELLRAGRLVAFPTETVYGLGANALSAQAVAGIFLAKQRPAWDPLIVHVASLEQLPVVAALDDEIAERVQLLAEAFWPGPLTLLLPRTTAIPDCVTAGRPLVGVRIPAHPVAHALLVQAGVPIAAPSANTFGHTSPTTAAHVLADLDGRIDAVLDGGPATVGLESTVLDPLTMTLYRPGAVTASQLEVLTGLSVALYRPPLSATEPRSLPSPGVGLRHYAPRARLILVEMPSADESHTLLKANALADDAGDSAGLLLPDDWASLPSAHVFPWGPWNEPDVLAARLFAGLRALDDRAVDVILAPLPAAGGIGDALRDRLQKAARPV